MAIFDMFVKHVAAKKHSKKSLHERIKKHRVDEN